MDRSLLELNPETKARLDRLKSHPEESYDLVLNRLIDSFEDGDRLTREEVQGIREILRDLKEGRFLPREQVKEQPAMDREQSPSTVGDPQAVKDMEQIFSGTARQDRDLELTPPGPGDTDAGDLHEIEGFNTKGKSRIPHLDSL
jgi:predicted transcriptional regulator